MLKKIAKAVLTHGTLFEIHLAYACVKRGMVGRLDREKGRRPSSKKV